MKLIDSKKKKLTMQEVITQTLVNQKDELPMPLEGALISIVKELEMPNSEAIQFGNTVFISHYDNTGKACVMRALNVDTGTNLLKSGELYVRHLMKQGVKYFMTVYNTESFGIMFKTIERKHVGQVLYGKTVYGDYEAHVLLNTPQTKEQRNAEAQVP